MAGEQLRRIAVGDRIVLEEKSGGGVWVEEVMPRATWLARSSVDKKSKEQVVVANVDQVAMVSSIHIPPFRPGLLDRMLIAAHTGRLSPIILINKSDLKSELDDWYETSEILDIYKSLGYPVICTSVVSGEGIEELRALLTGKTTVFAGHSGVGKSSLVSMVDPTIQLKTGDVSQKTCWGQHTTTTVTLLPLAFGGFVVDTPGIREFSLWQLDYDNVAQYFPEIAKYALTCKYKNCKHVQEPDCAVQQAVAADKIAQFRYQSYCRILESGEREIEQAPVE